MRDVLKATLRLVALVAVSPVLLYYRIARGAGGTRSFESCSQLLSLVPGLTGQYVRRAFYSRTLGACANTAVISFGVVLSSPKARIGPGAYIGPFCTLGLVDVGADVLIAAGAQVPSGSRTHGISTGAAIRNQEGEPRLVTLAAGAWIGNNAVIMADVGAESIVGAGAVVTRPVPPGVVAAGVPARVIRSRNASGEAPVR